MFTLLGNLTFKCCIIKLCVCVCVCVCVCGTLTAGDETVTAAR